MNLHDVLTSIRPPRWLVLKACLFGTFALALLADGYTGIAQIVAVVAVMQIVGFALTRLCQHVDKQITHWQEGAPE